MKIKLIGSAIALLVSLQALGADIGREIQNSGNGKGTFGEFGVSFVAGSEPLVGFNGQTLETSGDLRLGIHANFEGRVEYKRAFVEVIQNSFSDVTLGFNAYSTETTNHEIILNSYFSDVKLSEVVGFESIEYREGDTNAGIRSAYYFGNSIVQLELVADVNDSHNGVIGTLQYGRQAQYRNWNFHGLLGARYFSDSVVDHYFGVSAQEATAALPEYKAGSGLMPSIQLGATLPLSEKWIFRANAEYFKLPSEVSDSPLAQGDSMYDLAIGFNYVFGS